MASDTMAPSLAAMEDSQAIIDLIFQRIQELSLNDSVVSVQLGHKRGYLYDYREKRSPKKLPDATKLKLARILRLHPAQLGVSSVVAISSPARLSGGMAEDVVDYLPGPNSPTPPPHIALKRMTVKALDKHPKGLGPGKVIAFDTTKVDPDEIPSGSVVWVQLFARDDPLAHRGTIIRQFIAPDLLVTNSTEGSETMLLSHPDQDFVAVIHGMMVYTIDDLAENGNRLHTVALTRDEVEQRRLR